MSEWIEYDGKGQPVDNDVKVHIRCKGDKPDACSAALPASQWLWDDIDYDFGIAAYRIAA